MSFNSKVVRLEAVKMAIFKVDALTFQFQGGAVRSYEGCKAAACKGCFNSKVVRLEVA